MMRGTPLAPERRIDPAEYQPKADRVQQGRELLRRLRAKDPEMTISQAWRMVMAHFDAVIDKLVFEQKYWAHSEPTEAEIEAATARQKPEPPTPKIPPAPPQPKKIERPMTDNAPTVKTPAMEVQRRTSRNNPIRKEEAERIRERVRQLRKQNPKHTAGMILPIISREFGIEMKLMTFYQYWNKKPKGVTPSAGTQATRVVDSSIGLRVNGAGGDAPPLSKDAKRVEAQIPAARKPETANHAADEGKPADPPSGEYRTSIAPAPSTSAFDVEKVQAATLCKCGHERWRHIADRDSTPCFFEIPGAEFCECNQFDPATFGPGVIAIEEFDAHMKKHRAAMHEHVARNASSSGEPILQVFDIGSDKVRVQFTSDLFKDDLGGFLSSMGAALQRGAR